MFDVKAEIARVLADVFEGTTPDAEATATVTRPTDGGQLNMNLRVYGRTVVSHTNDSDGDLALTTLEAESNVAALDCFKTVVEGWRESAAMAEMLMGVPADATVITSTLDDADTSTDDTVVVDAPNGWATV